MLDDFVVCVLASFEAPEAPEKGAKVAAPNRPFPSHGINWGIWDGPSHVFSKAFYELKPRDWSLSYVQLGEWPWTQLKRRQSSTQSDFYFAF